MKKFPLINLLAYLLMAVANFFAANGFVFGNTPADVSHLYDNMFTPADFTFSIWGLIYLALGYFVIKDFWNRKEDISKESQLIGYWFALTSCLNVAWLITWLGINIQLSFVCIFLLWAALAWLYYQLAINNARPLYTIPISLYLGWIAVSILGHLNVLLMDLDLAFLGMPQETWTIILVIVAIIGGLLMHYWNKDIVFNLVLVWAFIGTYSKNYMLDSSMVQTLIIGMTTLILVSAYVGWQKMTYLAPENG